MVVVEAVRRRSGAEGQESVTVVAFDSSCRRPARDFSVKREEAAEPNKKKQQQRRPADHGLTEKEGRTDGRTRTAFYMTNRSTRNTKPKESKPTERTVTSSAIDLNQPPAFGHKLKGFRPSIASQIDHLCLNIDPKTLSSIEGDPQSIDLGPHLSRANREVELGIFARATPQPPVV